MNGELNRHMAHATKWSTITEIAAKLVAPITSMALARLLPMEAFGVVATVQIIVTFADIFTDAGFQKYLVQREFSSDEELSKSATVAFYTNLALSLFIWGLIAVFAEPLAIMLKRPGLGNVIIASCAVIPLTAFSSIQMALFRRRFDFRTLFHVRLVGVLLPLIVTVPLAIWLKNYWALVIGSIAMHLSNAVILMLRSPWKPRLYFSPERLRGMLSFSVFSLLEALSIWLTANADIFIVTRAFNDHNVSLYSHSMTTINSLLAVVTASITPVLFSALSRLQTDPENYERTFFKYQRWVAMLVLPLGVGIFCYSDLVTNILLSEKWAEASPLIGIWALVSAVMIVFAHFNSEIFRSRGRPSLSMLSQLLFLVVLIPGMMILSKTNINTLFFGRTLLRFESMAVSLIILWFAFKISFFSMLKNVAAPLISSVAMGALAFVLRRVSGALYWEIISIVLCAAFYAGALMLNADARREILDIPLIKRIRSRA